jgi:CubicO group peptidase (beta-lactamase class C family)
LQREADVLNVNNTLDEFIKRVAKLPLNSTARQRMALQHFRGHSRLPGAETLRHALRGVLGEAHLQAAWHDRHRLLRAQGEVEPLRRIYTYDQDGKLQAVKATEGLNHDFSAKPALLSGGGGLVSTASDYMRFCQMLLNGGQLNGVRLLSPRTVELMRTNVLAPGLPIFSPGAGFGLDFAVYTDPVAAGGYYGKGTLFWGGAAGTWFWIDPANDLIVVGMIQQAAPVRELPPRTAAYPDVRGLSHAYTYQAVPQRSRPRDPRFGPDHRHERSSSGGYAAGGAS